MNGMHNYRETNVFSDRVEVGEEYCRASDQAGQLMDELDKRQDPAVDTDRLNRATKLLSEAGAWFTPGLLELDPRDVVLAWKLIESMRS